MAKRTRATPGEPMRWLTTTLAELAANPTDACIAWPFAHSHGYARIGINGHAEKVAEVVLTLTVGPRPLGMHACHKPVVCHNPGCINPRHLRWDTPLSNMLDQHLDGTRPIGTAHKRSKLSERDAWEVRQLWATGEWTQRQLATEFQVRRYTIQCILDGSTWAHIRGVPPTSPRDHPALFT